VNWPRWTRPFIALLLNRRHAEPCDIGDWYLQREHPEWSPERHERVRMRAAEILREMRSPELAEKVERPRTRP
jgi:hypothetical protein